MPSARGLLVPLSIVIALSACGRTAESGAETTSAPAPREPRPELDALQRDLEASEAQLAAELERRGEPPLLRQRKADGAAPADATPQGESAASPKSSEDDAPRSACDLACRALSSMRRSADGICSLTATQHERCAGARERVEAATRRVATAGCLCPP